MQRAGGKLNFQTRTSREESELPKRYSHYSGGPQIDSWMLLLARFSRRRQKDGVCRVGYSASVVAQTVKNSPAMQETRILSLSQKDSLQKEMATHFSILAWSIPWTEKPGGLQSIGVPKSRA